MAIHKSKRNKIYALGLNRIHLIKTIERKERMALINNSINMHIFVWR